VLIPAALEAATPRPMHEPVLLLHAVLRFHAPVFLLKDDFRI